MRIYAVLAHDDPASFNAAVFEAVCRTCREAGAEVDELRLYDRAEDLKYYVHGTENLEAIPFYRENRERFMAADRLAVIHPTYWYSLPGILKTWVDYIGRFAWEYRRGPYARRLHRIQRAAVANSGLAPGFARRWFLGNTATRQMKETLRFIGIRRYRFMHADGLPKSSPEQRERWLKDAERLARWLVRD